MIRQIKSKVHSWASLRQTAEAWREAGQKIVFTNGCFDLLHYGHIHYLAEARALGDMLVIGLNSDASVRRLKGAHRPHKDEKTRQFILAALACVDAVTLFEEDTPYELIRLLQPDILVKGGDWQAKDIIGSDIVLDRGGEVRSLSFIEGNSTTSIEEKIRKGE